MLKRAASRLLVQRNPVLNISHRTSVHFKYEPEEAPAAFGKEREEKNMCQAIEHAMDLQLDRDESTIIFGEDVKFGGVFRPESVRHF